jgi:basic amino acid/polyamine antiporter, APA family
VLSILACGYILASLHWYTWLAFSGWVSLALIYYLLQGRHRSALNDEVPDEPAKEAP